MKSKDTYRDTFDPKSQKAMKFERPRIGESRVDRISDLPEPLLHEILSYLPTKDATRTSTLSKRWNSAWKSFPILDFNQYTFLKSSCPTRTRTEALRDFCRHVDGSISARRGFLPSVVKFKVVVNFHASKCLAGSLGRWLEYAVENDVRDLAVEYHGGSTSTSRRHWRYVLPLAIFEDAKRLQTLDLFGCRFADGAMTTNIGIGRSLRKLALSRCHIDQETLESLVSGCPLLEEVIINLCQGFDAVCLTGAKLCRADLYLARVGVQMVGFDGAPNLESLSYGGGFESVRESIIRSSKCWGSVKKLKFHDVDVTDGFFEGMAEFEGLERLELERCHSLERVKVSGFRIKGLWIKDCIKLKQVEVDAGCLSWFSCDGLDVNLKRV